MPGDKILGESLRGVDVTNGDIDMEPGVVILGEKTSSGVGSGVGGSGGGGVEGGVGVGVGGRGGVGGPDVGGCGAIRGRLGGGGGVGGIVLESLADMDSTGGDL